MNIKFKQRIYFDTFVQRDLQMLRSKRNLNFGSYDKYFTKKKEVLESHVRYNPD